MRCLSLKKIEFLNPKLFFIKNSSFIFLLIVIASCTMSTDDKLIPPSLEKIPNIMEAHGDIRIDNYYWLRDDTRSDPKMLNYLKLENDYADMWFEERTDYKSVIYNELIDRIVLSETSFKIKKGDYLYFNEITSKDQLPKYYRSKDGKKELIIDPNIKLETQEYYSINSVVPSSDNSLIAFNDDDNGRREFTIKILNSEYELLDDEITKTSYGIFWSSDNRFIIYLKKDPVTLIANQVYVHEVGTSQDKDILIYKEEDSEFNINLGQSRTDKFIYINIEKTNANEIRLIDAANPKAEPKIAIVRSEDHLYSLEHANDDSFYVRSNLDSPNYKIYKAADIDTLNETLDEIAPHNPNIFISDHIIFDNYLILEIRENGLPGLQKIQLDNKSVTTITFNDNSYYVSLSYNYDSNDQNFYYSYSSPTQPITIYSQALENAETKNLWQKEINNFNPDKYTTSRQFIVARDGVKVPVTITHLKDIDLESAPILFYGYGSYGLNTESYFRSSIIPLLERNFIHVLVNVRGGGEMGKHWYEQGRMFNKLNTFYDFNDAVKSVLNMGIGNKDKVFAQGGSAGGLLMGAIINFEPELYTGILSGVPFVDVLTTMSDASIPLTTFEWDEWGNPENKDEYMYMKQYSPYDNIAALNYPAVLVTSSLFDSQVQYYEPAKYTPKLREYSTSENPILMKMNLIGGHGGKSGRLNQMEETAEEYGFLLNLLDE